MLKVCEIFKSIQGEGLLIGMPTIFIRLHGCNLRCKFCDTKYTWDSDEYRLMSEDDIIKDVFRLGKNKLPKIVTITGGEPLLQDIRKLVKMLISRGFEVYIETNGTITPPDELVFAHLIVSPKLSNSGQTVHYKRLPYASYYKFVITSKVKRDIEEVNLFIKRQITGEKYLETILREGRIILQPDGTYKSPKKLLKRVVQYVQKHNLPYRVLPQLHRQLWGLKRGV